MVHIGTDAERLCYNSLAPLVDAADKAHLPGPLNDAE
jgi:hypothetical protein